MIDMTPGFIDSQAARETFQAIDAVRTSGGVAMLVGETGTGKTAMLRAYAERVARETDNAPLLFHRSPVVNTPKGFVMDLLAQLGILWHGSTRPGFAVLRRVIGEARVELVMIDDAQRLSRSTLDQVRSLHEATGIAVILAGTRALGRVLATRRGELAHRIRLAHGIGTLELEDVIAAVNSAGVRRQRCAYWKTLAIARLLLHASHGNFRRLMRVLDIARTLARSRHRGLSSRIVAQAAQQLCKVA